MLLPSVRIDIKNAILLSILKCIQIRFLCISHKKKTVVAQKLKKNEFIHCINLMNRVMVSAPKWCDNITTNKYIHI